MASPSLSPDSLLICAACGTQFPTASRSSLPTCFICDDPRQYTPPSGQSFTSHSSLLSSGYKNTFAPFPSDARFISISTTPKFAIGQRAILVRTSAGNILWDCLSVLDEFTISEMRRRGGLGGIVISHPHYYSAHVEWAEAFDCPVYLAAEDEEWLARRSERQVFLEEVETAVEIGGVDTGIRIIKLGGHFPGSLVLLYEGRLLIADTLMTTPAGMANWKVNALGGARERPSGANSFAFMWSIPNFIPLGPDDIVRMWSILKDYHFTSTHGAFAGQDIEDVDVKGRVLQSMQIQIRSMGYRHHPFLHTL